MVSSFSNPGFPPVHAHPTRLPAMDASLSAALDSFEASMCAAFRAAIHFALATFCHELSLLRRDLALAAGGVSDPAPTISDDTESIDLGHPGLHGDDNSPRIPSPIAVHSIPPLLSSSPLLQAMATPATRPQSNDSVAATILLLGNEFAPHTLFRKIGAEFRQSQPLTIANKCQKELVGMYARYVFDEIPDSCCSVVLDRDMCYCKGIQDKGGGSKFRPLEDSRMRLGEKIVLSDYDDNIGYFIKKKLHVWCQVPSGLWELRMIRQHWFSTGVRGLVSAALLNDQLGWINWYLVGEFVKKDFYALELFEIMSERGSEDKLEIFQWISATFHQYATSGPQLGNELSQFKNVEFDHVAKEIQNVGVRWISLPTASILLLLFEEIIVRRLYDLVPIYSATKTYLMNAISKNIIRLREFFRPINPVFSQEIACYMVWHLDGL